MITYYILKFNLHTLKISDMRKIKTIYLFVVLLVMANLFLNNSGNPPNGKSGAPGDGTCADCHNGGSFSGSMFLTGLPPVVNPNTTYSVTLTNSFTGTAPDLSGFQLTARTSSNQEAGSISNPGAASTTTIFGGKTYLEHNPAQFFGGNTEVSWTFDWTAPNGSDGENYTFFYSGVFADGTGGTGGDAVTGGAFSVELDVPQPLVATATVNQNVSCFGDNDGIAMVTPSGGTPPFSYNWSNGDNNATIFSLSAGNYDVTVSDALGQQAVTSVNISEPSDISIVILNQTDITCSSTGSVMVNVSGGNGGYNYQWSSGGTSQMESFTIGGNYTLTVTDAIGCTAILPVNIFDDSTLPTAEINMNGTLSCAQSSIILDGAQSTGTGQLSYLWTDSNNMIIGTSPSISVSTAGSYTLEVTDTQNGCTDTASINVDSNVNIPTVNISGNTELNCNITSTNLIATTDINNPIYEWTDNGGTVIGTNSMISVNQAGDFTIMITDPTSGCFSSSSITIFENTTNPEANAGSDVDLTCDSTTITLNGMNSTPNSIHYEWLDDQNMIISDSITAIITESGTYYLIVTDTLNGCSDRDTVEVNQNIELPIADAGSDVILTCFDNNTNLDGSGSSSGNFSYLWTTTNGSIVTGETSTNPLVDAAGTYTLAVTNTDSGCLSTDEVIVSIDTSIPNVEITAPSVLNCNNTTLVLDGCASSGDGNSYEWTFMNNTIGTDCSVDVSAEGEYTLIVTSSNGCSSSSTVMVESDFTTPIVTIDTSNNLDCANPQVLIEPNISSGNTFSCQWFDNQGNAISTDCSLMVNQAGVYTIEVTDVITGCVSTASVMVAADIALPNALASTIGTGILDCNTTCVTLVVLGSSEGDNITYSWVGPSGFATSEINPCVTEPGTYTLIVTDTATGCINQATVGIVQDIEEPFVEINPVANITCNNQLLTIQSNTSAGVSYNWTTTDGNIVSGSLTSSPTINTSGTYTLTVTGANGCSNSASILVTEADSNIQLTANSTNVDCNGSATGSASVTTAGGVAPYMYNWSNGETTETISGLSAGTYIVDVMDINGCLETAEIIITEPNALIVQIATTDETTTGASDGTASASVNGGTAPYTYLWSNGETSSSIDNLSLGVYELTVTDSNGCVSIEQTTILGVDCDLSIATESTNVLCFGDNTGSATVDFMGGTVPVTFEWSNGATTQSISNLVAGTYTVTVSDNAGCFEVAEVVLTEPQEVDLEIIAQGDIDCENEFGFVNIRVNGNDIITFSMLNAGITSLTVFDQDGCSNTIDINIQEIDNAPVADAGDDTAIILNCIAFSSTTATLDGSGSTGWVTLEWSGPGNIDLTNPIMPTVDSPGTYTLIATNDLGCTSSDEVVVELINDLTAPIADIANPQTVICADEVEPVTLDGTPSSQGDDFTYEWIDGMGNVISSDITATIDILPSIGNEFYSLVVTDIENGCTASAVAELIVNNLSAAFQVPSLECDVTETEIEIIAQTNYPPVTYVWEDGSTDSTYTVTGNEFPSATITDATGCTFVLDDVVTIIFTPALEISEVINNATDDNANGSIDITVEGGSPPYIYEWSNGATTEDIENLEAGTYDLLVQDVHGCEIENSYVVDMITSIDVDGLSENKSITLSPNPNTGQFWIEWEGADTDRVQIEIVDFTGKQVYQNNDFIPTQQAQLIHLENAPTGIYMVNFYTNKGLTASKKMMISQ